jgi:hypothetical protein
MEDVGCGMMEVGKLSAETTNHKPETKNQQNKTEN